MNGEASAPVAPPARKRARHNGGGATKQATAAAASASAVPSPRTTSAAAAIARRTRSVVKLFVKTVPVSYTSPWRKETQHSCTGTGPSRFCGTLFLRCTATARVLIPAECSAVP